MVETFWRNLPEEWLTFWENLPEGLFLPFAILLFYWLGRHWTIQAARGTSIRYAERLDELEEKGRDIKEFALRQNLQNVAALSGHAKLTNGLLGAILAALIFR
jgi:hypothetical protein